MQAIILAGGKGTRLKSITKNIPKSLIPLPGKTLLDYIINHIEKNNCDNIIICAGYLGNKIKKHLAVNNYKIPIKLSIENEPLGTAGALSLIENNLEDEFFVLYGDVYTTINLKKMFKFHKKNNADLTLALHVSDHPQDSTVVIVNKRGKIINFKEKPGDEWEQYGNLTTTPLYIMNKNALSFVAKSKTVDFAKDVFPAMLRKNKKIFGYITDEYAKDVGTVERYYSVVQMLKNK